MLHADFVIIGAGIVGLSVARELAAQYPQKKIIILEKERKLGLHASGRNSGVLHSGIYYQEESLKARFCREGAQLIARYCDEHKLPIHRTGKLIIPQTEQDIPILDMLYQRAQNNGAKVSLMTANDVKLLEPSVRVIGDNVLFSPETAVVDPKAILLHVYQSLLSKQVAFYFNSYCTQVNTKQRMVTAGMHVISYGHLFNTAGLHADTVARACGLEDRYTMVPFKGLYYELLPTSKIQVKHLIYPVPDMNVPFLGVHVTRDIQGKVYLGPTAIPALGREHYRGLEGLDVPDACRTLWALGQQYRYNKQGFRRYAHQEIPRFLPSRFLASVQALIPDLRKGDVVKSAKVGIRAQVLDKQKQALVMDFLVRKTAHETHVLNAVSPAFTSAFSFANYVVDGFEKKEVSSESD
jgi:(S)-2-hydroxyglutarate dehydrogenase